MRKQIALMSAIAFASLTIEAAPITPQEALERAGTTSVAKIRAIKKDGQKLRYTYRDDAGNTAAYVFSNDGSDGYMILSANDLAVPVLGYVDRGDFNSENMPPALKWWLSQYAEEISYAEKVGLGVSDMIKSSVENMDPIGPLCKTRWDQGAPFWDQTPVIGSSHTPSGCVATSMAQAMNYFKYPERGTGDHSYTLNGKTLSIDFSAEPFDWNNMIDYYSPGDYTEQQGNAVAYLMKACGYSVDMTYTAAMSGAVSNKIADALSKYFGYDGNIHYATRDAYSYDEWIRMCYENLRDCGPIIYNGRDPLEGGHSFIVDGYDGNGYFHLNWGWGGMSDGYYVLNALTPTSQGLGGATGGFNYKQDAVLGMQKPTGRPVEYFPSLTQMGSLEAAMNGARIEFSTSGYSYNGWYNMTPNPISIYMGIKFEKDGEDPVYKKCTLSGSGAAVALNTSQGVGSLGRVAVVPPKLADGRYKMTMCTIDASKENDVYTPVIATYGLPNYAYLIVDGGNMTVENVKPSVLQFETAEFTSPLYLDRNTRIKAHIINNSDLQLTAIVTPALVSGGRDIYRAETVSISVDPNTSADYEWIARFYQVSQGYVFENPSKFTLRLYNQDSGRVFGNYGEVEMTKIANGFSLSINDFSIVGANKETLTVGGKTYNNVYVVADPTDFTVKFDYTVSRGYFDTPMVLGIYRRNASGGSYIPVTDYIYEEQPMAGEGEKEQNEIKVKFMDNNPDNIYYIRAEYMRNNSPVYLSQITFHSSTSDVDGITISSDDLPVEYYNLMGQRVEHPQKGQILIKRHGAKSEKILIH